MTEPGTGLGEAAIALKHDNDRQSFDMALSGGRLETDAGLASVVFCSLFTDARIDEAEARARKIEDRRGYWADAFSSSGAWGSTLWALARSGVTQETALLIEGRAKRALAWLVEIGVAASVETSAVAVSSARNPRIELSVRIRRPAAPASRYQPLWEHVYAL